MVKNRTPFSKYSNNAQFVGKSASDGLSRSDNLSSLVCVPARQSDAVNDVGRAREKQKSTFQCEVKKSVGPQRYQVVRAPNQAPSPTWQLGYDNDLTL